jgi:hypothetical protein
MNRNFVFQTLFEVKGRDKRTKKEDQRTSNIKRRKR